MIGFRVFGYSLVAAGSVMWASAGVVSSVVLDAGVTPTELVAIRMFGSVIVLGAGGLMLLRGLDRRSILRLAVFGTIGMSLPQISFYLAIQRIDVAIALVIIYCAPIIVALYDRFVRHVRLPARVYVAVAVAVCGVLAAILGREGGLGTMSIAGLALAVAAMGAYAVQVILAASLPSDVSAVRQLGAATVFGAALWLVVIPVWTLPFDLAITPTPIGAGVDGTVSVWVLLLYITIVGTILPYACIVGGASRIGAGAASVTGMIEPVAAAIFAWILLAQSLTPVQIVGGAVALVGVVAAERLRSAAVDAA